MNRRSFFKSLARSAAFVAAAKIGLGNLTLDDVATRVSQAKAGIKTIMYGGIRGVPGRLYGLRASLEAGAGPLTCCHLSNAKRIYLKRYEQEQTRS